MQKVYSYYARLTYPNSVQSSWQIGETGGWWVSQAGTYYIEGKAWAKNFFGGSEYWAYREPFPFKVVDSPKPQTLTASISGPNSLEVGQQGTWTVTVSGGTGSYTYAWYFGSGDTGGQWSGPVSTSNSYTTRMYDYDKYLDLRADVTSGSEQVSTTRRVACVDCSGGPLTPQVPVGSVQGSIVSKDPVERVIVEQNYPNPFNPSTEIKYSVKTDGFLTIKVYDMLGKEVAVLVNENKPAGYYKVNFDASKLTSGVYIYTIKATALAGQANDYVQSKKMLLIK